MKTDGKKCKESFCLYGWTCVYVGAFLFTIMRVTNKDWIVASHGKICVQKIRNKTYEYKMIVCFQFCWPKSKALFLNRFSLCNAEIPQPTKKHWVYLKFCDLNVQLWLVLHHLFYRLIITLLLIEYLKWILWTVDH